MSIDQPKVIDARSLDKDLKEVHLFIFDHLDWNNVNDEHLFKLQEKINTYLAYIESGEIYENDPIYKGKSIVIHVIAKYTLPSNDLVKRFYEKATSIVQWAGFDLQFEHRE